MGYTAVGVGPVDVRVGEPYFNTLKKYGIPVVHIDTRKHEDAEPYIIRDVSGVKVGIVSFGSVPDERREDSSLQKEREKQFSEARKKCDILLLMDQAHIATEEWLTRNKDRLGSPDIVIGGVRVQYNQPETIGKTMIVPTSTQGVYVGRIDIKIDGKKRNTVFSRQIIDPTIPGDPEVEQMISSYNKSQSELVASGALMLSAHETQPYYPYQSCVTCHKAEYEHWKDTKHALAHAVLLNQEKAIPECLPCHSDMYRLQRKMAINSEVIGGVECNGCHQDVLPHSPGYRAKHDDKPIRARCLNCHTPERSPNFDPVKAYEQMKHPKH